MAAVANDRVNKPVAFRRSDPVDGPRLEYARSLPNFSSDVKQLIDAMKDGGFKSFGEWLMSLTATGAKFATLGNLEVKVTTEEMGYEEGEVDFDAGQFL